MADIICRWRNGTPKNVVELVNSLPHKKMRIEEFRSLMDSKWVDFFTAPYQLACQLGLYCEAEDGYYYPRFDHDINEEEATAYLYHWLPRYYVPNPYVGKDGFKDIVCPTFVLKSLFDYTKANPGTDYASAYKAIFKENAKNNDDIVRNYINRYSQVMEMTKEGELIINENKSQDIFGFMNRNDKKAFFDNFESKEVDPMKMYQEGSLDQRKAMFRKYLESLGKAESTIKQYIQYHLICEPVLNVIKKESGKDNLYEVVDLFQIERIYKGCNELAENKSRNNVYSASVTNYKNFIDFLETEEAVKLYGNTTMLIDIDNQTSPTSDVSLITFSNFSPSQIIYYGAPGTGKSHTIKGKEDRGLRCIRTTFHPDSDYSTFVGCYKPHRNKETGDLSYEFVEQAFLEAYKLAWKNPQQEIALVIEEINRGNCAQIFGDIFQLLDRDEDGWSTYPIKADTDIYERLTDIAIPGYSEIMAARYGKDKEGYGFMALPPNMSLLATMNTSDQSLFPIDSAFKRRWDWQYMPIANGGKNWKIVIGTTKFDWWQFIKKINAQIGATTSSEDKKLGYYFCKANDGRIDAKTFVGKVIFYLWNDVFKDYEFEGPLFEDSDGEKLTFDKFYKMEAGQAVVETSKVLAFLRKLDVTINPAVHMEEKGVDAEYENGESSNTTGYVAVKFSLNGGSPLSMTQIAKQVVSDYAALHPTENGEQIRDAFNTACNHIVVETEADYKARLEKAEKTHGGQELVLESGEKIYTSNQWEWKSADSSFARFMTVVNENGWGEIVEIKDNNE